MPEIRSFYELLGFSSLIACYLVRLGDQISFSGLSKFFLRGGGKDGSASLEKMAHTPMPTGRVYDSVNRVADYHTEGD